MIGLALSTLILISVGLFLSPLHRATVFTSPLPVPTAKPAFQSLLPVPTAKPTIQSPLPTPSVLYSPLAAPGPQASLPPIQRHYPPQLSYGAKGLAGADTLNLLGEHYDVYHTWAVSPGIHDTRLARMVWCVDDYHLYSSEVHDQSNIIQAAQSDAGTVIGRVWLIMNEPDAGKESGQCGSFPLTEDANSPLVSDISAAAEVAIRYSMVYDWIKSNDPQAKVFAGGLLQIDDAGVRNWWTTFVNTLSTRGELYKIEGVHVHSYPNWSTGRGCESHYCMPEMAQQLDTWYADYHVGLGLGDRPIWITETGAGNLGNWFGWQRWDPQGWVAVRDNIMIPFSYWFTGNPRWPYSNVPTNPGYDSMHWFIPWWGSEAGYTWWFDFLEDGRSTPAVLTPLGEYWRSVDLSP